ncbi:MAG: hypothetical protein AAF497_26570 [Planctomycetota bacterium]
MRFLPFVLVIVLIWPAEADERQFPVTSSYADKPTATTDTARKLGFCILDFGSPHIYGSPASFWIDGSGRVATQQFEAAEDGMQETRHEYTLTVAEQRKLLALLETLRDDDRVLKERYLVPGEFSPNIAFTIRPSSDLNIRQKHLNDGWREFTAVWVFLSDLHRHKTKGLDPVFVGPQKRGKLWEPKGFIGRSIINGLGYISSERYDAILEAPDKSEQGGPRRTATAPESKSEANPRPKPEAEERSQ